MHTRSAKDKDGKFLVSVYDWNGSVFALGEFSDMAEADQYAQQQERRMTLAMQAPKDAAPLTMAELLMSDDELLAELTA